MSEIHVQGKIPTSPAWGPAKQQDPKAKAVKEALSNPAFYICFFIESEDSVRTDLLVAGNVEINRLYHIQEALYQLIDEQERILSLQKPDKTGPQLEG